MSGKNARMKDPKVTLGAYSTNNNWSMTFWVYMQL